MHGSLAAILGADVSSLNDCLFLPNLGEERISNDLFGRRKLGGVE